MLCDQFEAFARSLRDALAARWALTTETCTRENPKFVYSGSRATRSCSRNIGLPSQNGLPTGGRHSTQKHEHNSRQAVPRGHVGAGGVLIEYVDPAPSSIRAPGRTVS